jgi:hypothetical protein
MSNIQLGAFDENNNYVFPSNAIKKNKYKCIECGQDVFVKKGNIKKHHFAHYSNTNCTYYEHPNESQIHKDAKYIMADLLKNKKSIIFMWNSECCCENWIELPTIIYKNGDEVVIEHRSPDGRFIADVAIVNNGIIRYIFEIKVTHKTETARPEPWYEIDGVALIKYINFLHTSDKAKEYFDNDYEYSINCIRDAKLRKCYGSFCYKEHWTKRIPCWDEKQNDNSCIICKKMDYIPEISDGCTGKFNNSILRLCTECFFEDIHKKQLRKMYSDDEIYENNDSSTCCYSWNNGCECNVCTKKENNIINFLEKYENKIPTIRKNGINSEWKQEIKSICCNKTSYSPIYYKKKFFPLCKICVCALNNLNYISKCIDNNEIKIKSEYDFIDD